MRKIKYRVVDGRDHTVHHSFTKENAERWIRYEYDGEGKLRILKKRD